MGFHEVSRKSTIARKPHRCIWCCWPILAGSRYFRERSVYDGSWQNFAWHEACRKDADTSFLETREEEFTSGQEMPFLALYQLEAQ